PDGYGLQTFALCIPACSAHLSSANTSFVFFVQAEDGIRDRNVTGVQTCALPICRSLSWSRPFITLSRSRPLLSRGMLGCRRATEIGRARVGKECRSRGSSVQGKKKGKRSATVWRGGVRERDENGSAERRVRCKCR